MNVYGFFDENDRFVINNPYTPEPWLHYLIRLNQPGTQTFCSGVSYTGGGFDVRGTHENTFVDTQLHLNDGDNVGRYVYIVDKKTGKYFTTTWQPVRNPGQIFKTTFSFGKATFESDCEGIHAVQEMFVPLEFDGWIQNITLKNTSAEPRELAIYPFVPIQMGNALIRLVAGDNDGFFGGAAFDPDLCAIVFRRHHGTAVNDDPSKINGMLGNVAAFYSTLNNTSTEYETSMERLTQDRFHSLADPLSILNGKLSNKNQAYLRRTCGVFKNEIALSAGESITFAVVLIAGSTQDYYLNNKKQLKDIITQIRSETMRKEMAQHVGDWWKKRMDLLTISSPDKKLNRAFLWLQYQCQIVYILNRMKSRYHTGYEYGWGFRDILQDVLYPLPYDAPMVAAALKHISTQMFSTGVSYHNFFIDQPGNKAIEASDDPLWFPSAVIKYCKESGNFSFLDEVTDYAEVREGQAGIRGTILEHCRKAIDRVWTDRSSRNLPFMKDCDWNDDLNELRKGVKPNSHLESVMVAQQLYRGLLDLAELFEASGRCRELCAGYISRAVIIKNAIQKYALDDEGYYKRALSIAGDGEDLGSSKNKFGKIFLESQCFGILSGVADENRAEKVIESVKKYLDTEYGAMLCYPLYTDLAEKNILPTKTWNIEKEPPAMKENGSIFMHLNAWLVQAYTVLGKGKDAVACYLKTLPENLASDQDRYKSEPYVYPEYVRGRGGEEFGRGGHTWLTGTAPTMHQALIEYIFGLKPAYDGLEIDPCVDPAWKEFSITRNFRGDVYKISISNPDQVERGVASIVVDGTAIKGKKLPLFNDGKVHVVKVVMG
jgi:cellobiose phosphorylase